MGKGSRISLPACFTHTGKCVHSTDVSAVPPSLILEPHQWLPAWTEDQLLPRNPPCSSTWLGKLRHPGSWTEQLPRLDYQGDCIMLPTLVNLHSRASRLWHQDPGGQLSTSRKVASGKCSVFSFHEYLWIFLSCT